MSNGVQGGQRESDAMEDESVDRDDVSDETLDDAPDDVLDEELLVEEPSADETPVTPVKKAGPAKKAAPAKKAVPANKGGRNSEPAALTKSEKRALAKQLAAKRAARERRRRIGGYIGTFVVILGIIAAVFVVLTWQDDDKPATPGAAGSATPTPGAEATTGPAVPFPGVPDGADPALKKKPEVKPGTGTLSKLVVTPIIEGKGPATANGQTLTVNYVGVKYATGEEFDSSWKRSQTFDFQLGGQVIQGWNQGLVGVKVGSRVQLDIPGNLAYGDTDDGSGSPTGPLRFVVDVLAAK